MRMIVGTATCAPSMRAVRDESEKPVDVARVEGIHQSPHHVGQRYRRSANLVHVKAPAARVAPS
jgi:hypothetical protein